ncbi:MAG: glycosyltransferase 61 family protein [Bacteroidota bacterium]
MDKHTIRKAFTIFGRGGEGISRVLETNIPKGYKNHLPHIKEVSTMVFTNPEAGHGKKHLAKGLSAAVTPGYQDVGPNMLNFVNKNIKIFKPLVNSFYHVLADDLAEVVYTIQVSPKNIEFIFDITDIKDKLPKKEWDLVNFFLECLDKDKIKYTLVDLSEVDGIYINNFSKALYPFHSGARLDLLYDYLTKHLTIVANNDGKRKIFISRARVADLDFGDNTKNFSYPKDSRMDDHIAIEQVFLEMGFEVVYGEDINTFEEQVALFNSARIVAGVTGSGLTNAMFMKPGGILIELATPLITHSPLITSTYFEENEIDPEDIAYDPNLVQELHMFYHNLAFFRDLVYVSIPNFTRKTEDIRKLIEITPGLREFISHE